MNWCDLSLNEKVLLVSLLLGEADYRKIALIIFIADKELKCGE